MNNENQLTPKQAIEILDKVTAGVQLTRQDHQAVILSLQALNALIPTEEGDNK